MLEEIGHIDSSFLITNELLSRLKELKMALAICLISSILTGIIFMLFLSGKKALLLDSASKKYENIVSQSSLTVKNLALKIGTSVCASLTRSTFCESAQTLNRGMAELGLLGSIISSVAPPAPSTLEVEVFPRFPRFELLLQPADDFDMDLCIPPPLFEPKKI